MPPLPLAEIEKRVADSYEVPNNVLQAIPSPLVSVRTSTYNHAPYIRKCIEGVLMQKTDFPFEFIIGEDFSTDGTREIVMEYAAKYPHNIRVITADYNVGSKANGKRCIAAARGKYMATCEGDDYWTDPYKLQQQADILNNDPSCALVHTELDQFNTLSEKYVKNHWKTAKVTEQSGDIYNQLISGGKTQIYTCTVMSRLNVHKEKDPERYKNYIHGDVGTHLHFAARHKIAYIDKSMAVRNVLPFSATQGRSFEHMLEVIRNRHAMVMDFHRLDRPFSQKCLNDFCVRNFTQICDLCFAHRARPDLFEDYLQRIKELPGGNHFDLILKQFALRHTLHPRLEFLIARASSYARRISR